MYFCRFQVAFRACDTQPCKYGNCQNVGNTFTCQCHPGYTGMTCNTPMELCEDSTCGKGECFTLSNETFTCG